MNSNPPPGCQVNLAAEGDLNNWEVVMDGPSESVYAVSSSQRAIVHESICMTNNSAGRQIQNRHLSSKRIPIQTTNTLLPHKDLPPECDER